MLQVHANWGGTEILATLNSVYAAPVAPNASRTVVFLTDGGISGGEEDAVFKLVSGQKSTSMKGMLSKGKPDPNLPAVLCLGIGDGVHRWAISLSSVQPNAVACSLSSSQRPTCLDCTDRRGLLDGIASRTGGIAQYVTDQESIARKVCKS